MNIHNIARQLANEAAREVNETFGSITEMQDYVKDYDAYKRARDVRMRKTVEWYMQIITETVNAVLEDTYGLSK